MTPVTTWTGREANALRKALRMSVSDFAAHLGAARRTVAKWSSRGNGIRLRHDMQAALDTVLARTSEDARERFAQSLLEGTGGTFTTTEADRAPRSASSVADTGFPDVEDLSVDGDVRRRDLLPLAVTALSAATVAPAVTKVLDALLPTAGERTDVPAPMSLHQLDRAVAGAKDHYQACRYEQVLGDLTALLRALPLLESDNAGEDLDRMRVLATDTYHVVGSVLLKLDDPAMALVAAERSVQYALASDDPVAAGTSARIMTHALMGNGHAHRAVGLTTNAAQTLDRATSLDSDDAVAVYGALVLRGAIAAARSEDRDTAGTLLDEASRAAALLGRDGNDRWTGFGPTNVLLHRVNVALTLGDAGSAISIARQVQLDKITLAERRACFAQRLLAAYTQWGRHEQALRALRTADRIAPEEVRNRSATRRIVGDLAVLAQGSVRTEVAEFATGVGIRL